MKKMVSIMILGSVVAFSACKKNEEPAAEMAPAEVQQQAVEGFPAVRDKFAQEFEAKLVQVAPRVEAVKQQAATAAADAKAMLEQEAAALATKVGAMQNDLAALKAAPEAGWAEVQVRLSSAMGEVEASLAKVQAPAAPAPAQEAAAAPGAPAAAPAAPAAGH